MAAGFFSSRGMCDGGRLAPIDGWMPARDASKEVVMTNEVRVQDEPFRLEEATIDELHAAIKAGETTCVAVVQHYIARVRAYNGVASALVTRDGAPVDATTGTVRAGKPLRFPTETVKASTFLPDLDKYEGPPLEYGRMEWTVSDPSVQQQFGMIV